MKNRQNLDQNSPLSPVKLSFVIKAVQLNSLGVQAKTDWQNLDQNSSSSSLKSSVVIYKLLSSIFEFAGSPRKD